MGLGVAAKGLTGSNRWPWRPRWIAEAQGIKPPANQGPPSFGKLTKNYVFEDFSWALADSADGSTLKPIVAFRATRAFDMERAWAPTFVCRPVSLVLYLRLQMFDDEDAGCVNQAGSDFASIIAVTMVLKRVPIGSTLSDSKLICM